MSEKKTTESRRPTWIIPLLIFACAFAARMIFVLQVKDSPFWRVPLIDARTYHELALQLLNQSWLAPLPVNEAHCTPYFQPPLYQTFLALIYLFSGKSVMAAILVQCVLGSISCALAYFIGRRLFSHRVGLLAGIAMALTASQIYYDGRLLPPALITILNLSVILLALKQLDRPVTWRWPVIGLLTGLSAIARPDVLLFLPVLLAWMWIQRADLLPKGAKTWICVVLVTAMIPVMLVALRNRTVGRDSVLISWNGGVNFLIGNNPSMEKTVAILPGIQWEKLINEPMARTGSTRPSVWDRYYYRMTLGMMADNKRATIRNFIHKFLWVWRGPETGRNMDEYYLRRVSGFYRILLWKWGHFGFPFSLIATLALTGMVMCWRDRRKLLLPYGYIVTGVIGLVLYFPCSRYRAPLTPILLIFASAAVFEIVELVRKREFDRLFPLGCLMVVFAIAPTIAPPAFERDVAGQEAENLRLLGTAYWYEGQLDRSIAVTEKGLEHAPNDADIHKWLMEAYIEKKDYPNAERHALECIRLAPSYGPTYISLVKIYRAEGKTAKADEVMRTIETYADAPAEQ